MALDKVLYTAHGTATGGREGTGKSSDGVLDVKLTTPKELGGNGATGTNPEQLFAVGYAACFVGAMKVVAGRDKIVLPADTRIDSSVGIGPKGSAVRRPGRAEGDDPRHGSRAGRTDRREGASGLSVLERDARQHRRGADRRLIARRSKGGAARSISRSPWHRRDCRHSIDIHRLLH